ncbi:MAG: DVU0150 family protein [Myxococcota bacterium]
MFERHVWGRRLGQGLLILLLIPGLAWAAGGGEVAPLVLVADSRHLSGHLLFWANLYNESHLLFALTTIAIIPIVGVMLGTLADLVMASLGIDLKSRSIAGH